MNDQVLREKGHDGAIYYGPACGHCGSRRTKRVHDTKIRQCQVCGESSLHGRAIRPEAPSE